MLSAKAVHEPFTIGPCSETICSADEPQGSDRELSFTLGAVHGALEVLTQKRFRAKQIGSVLRGDTHDVVRFTPR